MASSKDISSTVSPLSRKKEIPIKKLHVSNLSGPCTKRELEKLFAQYGEVECNYLKRNFASNNWAFITYKSAEDAARALEAARKKEIKHNGKYLRVDSADARHQPDSADYQKKVALIAARKAKNKKKIENIPIVIDEPNGPALINNLNDDCLARIFTNLPIEERVNIERVCKRWKEVCQQAWNDVKSLNFSQSPSFERTDLDKLPLNYRTNNFIGNILMRCGRYLNHLKLGSPCKHQILPLVGKHCHNLERLEIHLNYYHSKSCNKLFRQMRRLQYLEIRDMAQEFSGEGLQALPQETLTQIHLFAKIADDYLSAYKYLPRTAHMTFKNLTELTAITFNGFSLKPNMIQVIGQKTALTFLSLANCAVKKGISLLTQLTNLEHLNLTRVAEVDDAFLISLSSSCKNLKYLNFNQCISITDYGVKSFAELSNLEELYLNDVFEVSDVALDKLFSLKKLECENCDSVNDTGIIRLLKYANNLEYMNLANSGVTEAILIDATRITKKRTNNLTLRVLVSTSVKDDWDEDEEYSPLLIVEDKEDDIFDDYDNTDIDDHDDYYDGEDDDEDDYDDDFDLFNPYDDYDDDDVDFHNVVMLL